MTLRQHLLLVVGVILLPLMVASLIAASISRSIQLDIGELRRDAEVPLPSQSLVGATLEFEFTNPEEGPRRISKVVRLSRERRPKLRGRIDAIDQTTGAMTILGLTLHRQSPSTSPYGQSQEPYASLAVGTRVEISASIASDGRWTARKIKTDNLKADDKVKGTITNAEHHVNAGSTLWISDARFEIPAGVMLQIPQGPLARHEAASRMGTAAQECLSHAHDLLLAMYLRRDAKDEVERAARKSEIESLRPQITDSMDDLQTYLAELDSDSDKAIDASIARGGSPHVESEVDRRRELIEPLIEDVRWFRDGLSKVMASSSANLSQSESLQENLESEARKKILPRLRAIELDAEESLKSELKVIAVRAQSASQLTIITMAVGSVLALSVAFFLTRTITRPVVELDAAAMRISRGDLQARVTVGRRDEIGHLGETFNRMAEALAASTISIGNLSDVIESLAGGLFIVSRDGTITSPNAAFLAMLGYERSELEGVAVSTIEPSLKVVENCRGVERQFRCKDGRLVPVSFSAAPLGSSADRGHVCLAEDLSHRKAMEAALRESVQEKDLLLRELHHRVKNNLQVITSLLDLQSREIRDPKALEKFQDSQDRIRSMALIHEQLFSAQDLGLVDLRAYLGLLVNNLEQSHVDPPGRITVSAEIEEIRLDLDRALSCGLIVNELVTNAIKHAFPPHERGEIVIRCSRSGADLRLEVSDNGRGFRSSQFPSSETLGQSLVRDLALQLGGSVLLTEASGAQFVLTFPMEKVES